MTDQPRGPADPDRSFIYRQIGREAGAAPIAVGASGYSRSLDRDGNGVACE